MTAEIPKWLNDLANQADGDNDVHLMQLLIDEVELLRAVMDAADAFLALPPEDLRGGLPFNQYTTADDCRAAA